MSVVYLRETREHRRGWIAACGRQLLALFAATSLMPAGQKSDQKPADHDPNDDVDEPVYEVVKGGDVQGPRLLHSVSPEFTPRSREQHIEGKVILSTVVTSKGEVRRVRVQKSLDKELDQKAIEALRQWQFAPGQKDNKPVATRVSVEIHFNVL